MLQKLFNTDLKHAYEACKNALRDYKCEEVYGDYKAGLIEAHKKNNFHQEEKIYIRINTKGGVVISISVNDQNDRLNLYGLELSRLQESMVLELISNKLR